MKTLQSLLSSQYLDSIVSASPGERAKLYEEFAGDLRKLPAKTVSEYNELLAASKRASSAASIWRKAALKAARINAIPIEQTPTLSSIFRDGDDYGVTVNNTLTVWFLKGDSKQTCLESDAPIPGHVERQWQEIATDKFLAALRAADPTNAAPNASAFIDALKMQAAQ